jgi:general secretion pathway protein B
MSYILDALKKIEHEKSKKVRPDGRVNISGDLFQERSMPAARDGIWKIVLLIVAASLVTGAGTWFLFLGSGRKSAAVVRPAVPSPPASVIPQVVTPVVPLPVQTQPAPAATSPAEPVPAVPKTRETAGTVEFSPRDIRRSKKQITVQSPSPYPKQAAPTVQPPADIKLSGIAWQDDRAARRVVVNGFLLKEGSVVSGAKIIEIQSDRVRFSSAAGQFELKFDAVLPSEVKR